MMAQRKKLGDRITELRKDTGLSQEKFAMVNKIDRTTMSKVEQGKSNVKLDTLHKIAKGLNIEVAELFINRDTNS